MAEDRTTLVAAARARAFEHGCRFEAQGTCFEATPHRPAAWCWSCLMVNLVDALALPPAEAAPVNPRTFYGPNCLTPDLCRAIGCQAIYAKAQPAEAAPEPTPAGRETLDAALRLAAEATYGWARYAKRDIEHREIARLHHAIAALRDGGDQ